MFIGGFCWIYCYVWCVFVMKVRFGEIDGLVFVIFVYDFIVMDLVKLCV